MFFKIQIIQMSFPHFIVNYTQESSIQRLDYRISDTLMFKEYANIIPPAMLPFFWLYNQSG